MTPQEIKTKCDATVQNVASLTKGKSEHEINKALQDAFPFHPNNLAAWRAYGESIYQITGRQMFGYDYSKTTKAKR